MKSFNGNTADLILLKAGTNMSVHCDLNKFITLNEQMEEEATIRPDILHFFGREKFIFLGKSVEILKIYVCGSHVYMYFYVPMK